MRFMLHVKFALRNGGTFQCRIHWKDSIVQIGTISNIKKQLCVSSNLIAIKIAIQEDDRKYLYLDMQRLDIFSKKFLQGNI